MSAFFTAAPSHPGTVLAQSGPSGTCMEETEEMKESLISDILAAVSDPMVSTLKKLEPADHI